MSLISMPFFLALVIIEWLSTESKESDWEGVELTDNAKLVSFDIINGVSEFYWVDRESSFVHILLGWYL